MTAGTGDDLPKMRTADDETDKKVRAELDQ
jgi:hypothetical protein